MTFFLIAETKFNLIHYRKLLRDCYELNSYKFFCH